VHHSRLGELLCEHTGLRLERHPPRLERAGPQLGEHTREVLEDLLGLRPDEIERLAARGVLS
jgi:formyl-CoA transferase